MRSTVQAGVKLDIVGAMRAVARHFHAPTVKHWKTMRQIIVYLKGTRAQGIVFKRKGGLKVSLCEDADNADKANDRR